MTESEVTNTIPSFVRRALYGGILAYMAVDGFKNNDKRVDIAEKKGVPMLDVLVPFVTGMLLVANLGIILWKFPRASAGAPIVFSLGTTPFVHNFWTMEGEGAVGEQDQLPQEPRSSRRRDHASRGNLKQEY